MRINADKLTLGKGKPQKTQNDAEMGMVENAEKGDGNRELGELSELDKILE